MFLFVFLGSHLFGCGGGISETWGEELGLPGCCPTSCDPGDWLWLWSNCSESPVQDTTGELFNVPMVQQIAL